MGQQQEMEILFNLQQRAALDWKTTHPYTPPKRGIRPGPLPGGAGGVGFSSFTEALQGRNSLSPSEITTGEDRAL